MDWIIRNGTVVDGSGAEPVVADIAISGDRITGIGRVDGTATNEIDADGLVVTPGFVDLHTHLDAQIGWDPYLTPLCWHGVTTALLGNCGVTFAPCKPADRETLAAMMETVEDIPKQAILEGLSWEWESYGEYLDALEALDPAVNVTGMVGHCALRYYVMGERGVEEQPTEQELADIARIAGEAVRDGAVGFSTSRFLGHYLPDGRHVPGTHARHAELVEIARRVGEHGGLMQGVLNFADGVDAEIGLLAEEARAGSRVLFSAGAGATPTFSDDLKQAVGRMREEGLDISAVSIPRSGGFLSGLHSGFIVRSGAWKNLFAQPFEARLAALNDEEAVVELVREAQQSEQPGLDKAYERLYWLGDGERPDYTNDLSLARLAAEAGVHPARQWLDMMRASGGRTLFNYRVFNPNLTHLEDMITTDWCMPGLGDAGAHVGQIMDCGWATFVLSYWHRDRGVYSLAEAVRRITSVPAHVLGLPDRGVLRPGARADVNVIDLERLAERQPEFVNDFPNGGGRFVQRARGYRATLCNGQLVVEHDELTGTRSGKVLRHGRS